jgi:hypothetical protein
MQRRVCGSSLVCGGEAGVPVSLSPPTPSSLALRCPTTYHAPPLACDGSVLEAGDCRGSIAAALAAYLRSLSWPHCLRASPTLQSFLGVPADLPALSLGMPPPVVTQPAATRTARAASDAAGGGAGSSERSPRLRRRSCGGIEQPSPGPEPVAPACPPNALPASLARLGFRQYASSCSTSEEPSEGE